MEADGRVESASAVMGWRVPVFPNAEAFGYADWLVAEALRPWWWRHGGRVESASVVMGWRVPVCPNAEAFGYGDWLVAEALRPW